LPSGPAAKRLAPPRGGLFLSHKPLKTRPFWV
jgi:hypothetical protein